MFKFIVKYLNFLKHIPPLPQIVDGLIKLDTFLFRREVLHHIDEIERTVLSWNGTSLKMHRYGGVQFDVNKKEIGHIHSNGLLDILLKREIKEQLIREGKVEDHHVFARSGWISFYIKTEKDRDYAIELLEYSYLLKQ
jgi:luciferase-like monooxygenase